MPLWYFILRYVHIIGVPVVHIVIVLLLLYFKRTERTNEQTYERKRCKLNIGIRQQTNAVDTLFHIFIIRNSFYKKYINGHVLIEKHTDDFK